MSDILSAVASRLDVTHLALLAVIAILVWLLVKREERAYESSKLTADAMTRTAEALTNLRVELARRASR